MSKDIRSFFTSVSKKPGTSISTNSSSSTSNSKSSASTKPVKKVTATLILSDDDVIEETPEKVKTKVPTKKRKVLLISSDSEDDTSAKTKEKAKQAKASVKEPEKLKPIDVGDIFKDDAIKQTKVIPLLKKVVKDVPKEEAKKPNKRKSKKNTELGIHGDDDFEKTLLTLDDDADDFLNNTIDALEESQKPEASFIKKDEPSKKKSPDSKKEIKIAEDINKKSPIKESKIKDLKPELHDEKSNKTKSITNNLDKFKKQKSLEDETKIQISEKPDETASKTKSITKNLDNIKKQKSEARSLEYKTKIQVTEKSDKNPKKRTAKAENNETPSKKLKLEHTDSGIDPDQERHERKRHSIMLYQQYKNRPGPKHLGEKELPKGNPDCLKNLCFLRTGVLDSLDGDSFDALIKSHGGRNVHSVSKKVDYIVVGDEPGPAKLAKAEDYKIPKINEDELLDLILTKSGKPKKYTVNVATSSFEDLGIELDQSVDTSFDKSPKKTEQKNKPITSKVSPKIKTEKGKSKINNENSPKNKDTSGQKELPKVNKPSLKSESEEKPSVATDSDDIDRPKKVEVSETSMCFTEKYKPNGVNLIIGQQGEGSHMKKLMSWLNNWFANRKKKDIPRPGPWTKNNDGSYFKCALLSGPPGVGKTTTATLVCKELGFDVVEFNASDTRSKRLLHEEVGQLLSSNSVAPFATGSKVSAKRRVLLMDEVDGMAGNEDRGGMQELINLIKSTHVPIICMCNDRMHQKVRSLANYCFDLRFTKPKPQQIMGIVMSIVTKENIKINPSMAMEIIKGTECDVRQTLNHLSMIAASNSKVKVNMESIQKGSRDAKKDTVVGPWEVCRMVFSESEQKQTLIDKLKLFFYDYSLGPLFIQENYLKVKPAIPSSLSKRQKRIENLRRAFLSADAISMGDIIDSTIRGMNNWALLETEGFFASVLPGHYMNGQITGMLNFPGWLGKNSKTNKHKRLLGEIKVHTRSAITGSRQSLRLDYLKPMTKAIITPLKTKGLEGIPEAVEVMKYYHLVREDLDSLVELCQWTQKKNLMDGIETKVKSAFTRTFNKEVPLVKSVPKAKKKKTDESEEGLINEGENGQSSDEEEKDDINSDAMIKIKKPKGKAVSGGSAAPKKDSKAKGKAKAPSKKK